MIDQNITMPLVLIKHLLHTCSLYESYTTLLSMFVLLQLCNAEMAPIATEQGIFRNTVPALVAMRELRSWSSTYGHFSLPPLASEPTLPEQSLLLSIQVAEIFPF
jgi:hypothetical protein